MLEAQRDKSSVPALTSWLSQQPPLPAPPGYSQVTAVEKPLAALTFPNSECFFLPHFQKKKKNSLPKIWSLRLAFDHKTTPKGEPW